MKKLELLTHILGMLTWMGMALLSFLWGERLGPVVAFFGLLTYAMGEEYYAQINTIANDAIAGWNKAIELAEQLLNERKRDGTW